MKAVTIILILLLLFIFLGCESHLKQDWQWVEVASYRGATKTNAETLMVYAVNGLNPELWTKTIIRHGQSQKIFVFSKDKEQVVLPVEVYDFGADGVLQVSRIFKYEKQKVFVFLTYNLPKN